MSGVPFSALLTALVRRPLLWPEAAAAAMALARRRWWRRRPFLPTPDADYMSWRIATAYGAADHPPDAHDVVAYLEWRRRQRT